MRSIPFSPPDITEEEIAGAVQHDDYVVYDAYFNFDVHNITGSGLDETGCQKKFTQKKTAKKKNNCHDYSYHSCCRLNI